MVDTSTTTLFSLPLGEVADAEVLSSAMMGQETLDSAELAALIENIGATLPDLLGPMREAALDYVQSQSKEKLASLLRGIDVSHWPQISNRLHQTLAHPHFKRFGSFAVGRGGSSSSIDVVRLIEADIKSFCGEGPSLVGRIPGLTSGDEKAFLYSRRVRSIQKDGQTFYYKGTVGSERLTPASQEEFRIFQAWLDQMGFSKTETASTDSVEVGRLRDFLSSKGVRLNLEIPLTPTQALYVLKLLERLSDRFYQGNYFRELHFESGKDGALNLEIYNQGVLTLSEETLKGSRRDLMGALLHGLGHATADRYGIPGFTEPNPYILPHDKTIPFEERKKINEAFEILKTGFFMTTIYALNWPMLAPFRTGYLAHSFFEFFAEMQFILMVDPEGLKRHIATLDELPRRMYEIIVREWEKYIKP